METEFGYKPVCQFQLGCGPMTQFPIGGLEIRRRNGKLARFILIVTVPFSVVMQSRGDAARSTHCFRMVGDSYGLGCVFR